MVLRYCKRTLVQQNKTITRSVGYQGCFVDGADVLQQNTGTAEQNNNKKGWLPGLFCWWCWCTTKERWLQQNKTITWSVGYQGHFVDGAEVLQKALGAAEENNNILTRSVGYQEHFVDGADVVHQNLGAAEENNNMLTRKVGYQRRFADDAEVGTTTEPWCCRTKQEQERLVTRGILLTMLRYCNRTLVLQNKNKKGWLPGVFCWWCWGTTTEPWCSRRKQHTNKKGWLPGAFCWHCWETPEPGCNRTQQ